MGLNNDWCEKIKKRDGYKCQGCGRTRRKRKKGKPMQKKIVLSIHHIKPQLDFPELRYCDENAITLCRECHDKLHLKIKV